MNLVSGEIAGDRPVGNGSRRFRSRPFSIDLPRRFAEVPSGPVTLGIRPENLRVQRAGAADSDIDLPVRLVEPLGKDTLLYFDIGSERPFIAVSAGLAMAELEAGEQVGLVLTRESLFLFNPDGRRVEALAERPERVGRL
jgi:multiple sugar transport system ATP-binding protein